MVVLIYGCIVYRTCEWTACWLVFHCVSFHLTLAGSLPRGGSLAFSLRRLLALSMASWPAEMVEMRARCGSDITWNFSGYCACGSEY